MKERDLITLFKAIGITLLIAAVLYCAYISAEQFKAKQAWLRNCARTTHGWIEREAVGDTVYTDSDGHPTGSSVNFEYYVRTPSGRRINYLDEYQAE